MSNKQITEYTFEFAIVESLVQHGNYSAGNAADYSPELGMFKAEVLQFLHDTQPKQWEKNYSSRSDVENKIIQRLYKEMDLRGTFDVIRNGFMDYGVRFKMAFFKPETGLNPETVALYDKNQSQGYSSGLLQQQKQKFS